MSERTVLLLIDPQNDFCDIPGAALPVAGADSDMKRVAGLIERIGGSLTSIHVTLDSHHPMDIAHPSWWVDAQGLLPAPFTVISAEAVRSGAWQARDAGRQAHSLRYVEALAERGRYQLIIWPEHCLVGGWGHNLHAGVADALRTWERQTLGAVDYVFKGMNPGTEHYSAVQAEVPDPQDAGSGLNRRLIEELAAADRVLIAGEALSHCVASTVRDIADQAQVRTSKLVLLTDCCSPVGGFEALGQSFIDEMVERGMQLAHSTDL